MACSPPQTTSVLSVSPAYRVRKKLVQHWHLRRLDDNDVARFAARFEVQTELHLDRSRERHHIRGVGDDVTGVNDRRGVVGEDLIVPPLARGPQWR